MSTGVGPAPCQTGGAYRLTAASPRTAREATYPRSMATGSMPSAAGSSKPRICP